MCGVYVPHWELSLITSHLPSKIYQRAGHENELPSILFYDRRSLTEPKAHHFT